MSSSWQTFLDNLNMDKNETSYLTEICDCNDGGCQLFYNASDPKFSTTGSCNELKLCAQIMKDKHLAKIQSHRFLKMEQAVKNDDRAKRIPAAGTERPVVKTAKKTPEGFHHKSLTAFF